MYRLLMGLKKSGLILFSLLMVGCASLEGYNQNTAAEVNQDTMLLINERQAHIKTQKISTATLNKRWGMLAQLAGKKYIISNDYGLTTTEIRWIKTGLILEYKRTIYFDDEGSTSIFYLWYDPAIDKVRFNGEKRSGHRDDLYFVSVDNKTVKIVRLLNDKDTKVTYKLSNKGYVYSESGFLGGTYELEYYNNTAFTQYVNDFKINKRKEIEEEKIRKREESLAFWNGLATGMQVLSQATAEVYADRQASDSTYSTQSYYPRSTPISTSSTYSSNYSTSSRQPSTTVSQPVQPKKTAIVTTASRNSVQEKKTETKRQAFYEAIIVCNKPDTAGRFRCMTPVDVISGGPGDKDWRTPEAFVSWASSSCPAARRLSSSTHLVWGCGFAATNNSNSKDRSAGVDVRGRNTYYCSPKETSCRRTSP